MTDALRWMDRAACTGVDPDLFFPPKGDSVPGESATAAKAVCASCPVRDDCLQYALTTNQRYGVWGGMTWTERRGLRKTRGPRAGRGTA
jgi:WhiB family redox-sensing transcriptional regulator